MKKLRFTITGMTCAACVAHTERAAKSVLGNEIPFTVSLLSSSLSLTLPDDADEDKLYRRLAAALRRAGYGLLLPDAANENAAREKEKKTEKHRLLLSAFLSAFLMLFAMWHSMPLPGALAAGTPRAVFLFVIQILLCLTVTILQRRFFRNGFSALFHGAPNMDSLVALGSGASFFYSAVSGILFFAALARGNADTAILHHLYFDSSAMILTLVSLGKYLEHRARARASGAVEALIAEEPRTARRAAAGEEEVDIEDVAVGELLLVREGEKLPLDGIVRAGEGSVNEAMLTGESLPRRVTAGDEVAGGTLLAEGALTVEVTRVGEETTLRQIAALLEASAATKTPAARLADRISAVFVPIVLAVSALTALVWLLLHNGALAFRAAVSVLVISCPCALGLATPIAITVGCGRGAHFGILFKNAASAEILANARYLCTDKTGTLTRGELTVTDILPLDRNIPEEELRALIASMEALSAHPMAKPLAALSKERVEISDFATIPGRGVTGKIAGEAVFAGNEALFTHLENAPAVPPACRDLCRAFADEGKSTVLLARGDRFLGVFALADTLRADSKTAVAYLSRRGVSVTMLTGDRAGAAKKIAAEAGIQDIRAELLPADKEAVVREYRAQGITVMVGDGINDAPALAAADVGIAVGAGTAVAAQSADVVIAGSTLSEAAGAVELGAAIRKNIRQNLFWALFYNAVCIPVAAGVLYPLGVLLSPMIAAAAMSCSSLFVVLNALRLTRFTPPALAEREKDRQNQTEKEKNDMFGKTKEEEIRVSGMSCMHCADRVEKALCGVRGVKSATVDLDAGLARVTAKESVTREALTAAVKEAGYEAE